MNCLILAAAQGGGSMQFLFTMGLMFVVLYFLIFRPQRKKQKDHKNMIDNLKIHDTIITTGGIIGKIVNIKKDKTILVVRVDETNNTKIEFQRNAVSGVISEEVKG
jgi:preprotein translocase subunit YajC